MVPASRGFSVPEPRSIRLATTTSLDQSGLLDALLPVFTRKTGLRVDVIATGSGAALTIAARGDCDLVITHAPTLEVAFLSKNPGSVRIPFMYGDFVIVGPLADPAGIRDDRSAIDAFGSIAAHQVRFVSRGDASGTHQKELDLWSRIPGFMKGSWYMESGQGMAETLRIADQRDAYTLSDRATFLAAQHELAHLGILFENNPFLRNDYAVIIPRASSQGTLLADFLTGPIAAAIIRSFKINGFPVFVPLYPDAQSGTGSR